MLTDPFFLKQFPIITLPASTFFTVEVVLEGRDLSVYAPFLFQEGFLFLDCFLVNVLLSLPEALKFLEFFYF